MDRIATLIFQREDFRPAAMAIPFAVTDGVYDTPRAKDWACGPFPLEYAQLGLRLRIGSTVLSAGKKTPAGMAAVIAEDTLPEAWTGGLERWKPEGAWRRALEKTAPEAAALYDPSQQRFAAETGELDLDGRAGTFKAVSWRSECLILSEKGTLQGTRLAVENEGGFAVAFVSAMDGKPLAESKRLLVMHLTDTQNSMVKFRNSSHTVMSSGGGLPPLVRRGQAKLSIRLDGEAAPKVFAVDMAGERKSAVAAKWEDGHLSFTAQTVREQGTALAYEIVRE